jgi:hypothetical protein
MSKPGREPWGFEAPPSIEPRRGETMASVDRTGFSDLPGIAPSGLLIAGVHITQGSRPGLTRVPLSGADVCLSWVPNR